VIVKEEERDEKQEIKLSRLIEMLTKKDLDRKGISKKGRKIDILREMNKHRERVNNV
jgi:hypothetical protein